MSLEISMRTCYLITLDALKRPCSFIGCVASLGVFNASTKQSISGRPWHVSWMAGRLDQAIAGVLFLSIIPADP